MYENSSLILVKDKVVNGNVGWESPSNIALIKYWGKFARQLPKNPSLSITLKNAVTRMKVNFSASKDGEGLQLDLLFNGDRMEAFQEKLEHFLLSILPIYPFLNQLDLKIETENTFPHSAGIASSASSLSALALCLCSIEKELFRTLQNEDEFFKKACYIARLGSGSASRSIYGGLVTWGKTPEIPGSTNEFADPFRTGIHPYFENLKDAILIVDNGKKKVSSSQGHALMTNHPFAESRFKQANDNFKDLLKALKKGDFIQFSRIVENEALTLHAMMMSSNPSFILMSPATIHMINKIQFFREQNKVDICFTLDAGPNIHLIYPGRVEKIVKDFINNELLPEGGIINWIDDGVGKGPVKIKI